MSAAMAKAESAKAPGTKTKALNEAERLYRAFLDRLRAFRVLDPACGSGNFLNLALLALKDLEHRASIEAEAMGLHREFPQVGPDSVLGIEINHYAAELARVSVWIGEIQWMLRNGFAAATNPILKPLQTIECRDALLNEDCSEAVWPRADAIIGNPPFLGANSMIGILGHQYVNRLRTVYAKETEGAVDLVTYWLAKSWSAVSSRKATRAGLVATQSIRRGASQKVLGKIAKHGRIFDAWDDEPWVVEGAAVRVCLICFSADGTDVARLDGQEVEQLYSDLSADLGLGDVRQIAANRSVAYQGPVKVGPFDIDGDLARQWLLEPLNANGRHNSDVLRPWANGADVTGRPSGRWIIDFGDMSENDAAMYEAPFEYVRAHVKPLRDGNRRQRRRMYWWQHGETVPGLRSAVAPLTRFILTPRVAKHRLFVWGSGRLLPDTRLVAVTREDDVTFGILHSRFHQLWSLRLGGWHGVGNDPQYTPSLGFETFPFPEGLTPADSPGRHSDDAKAKWIAKAAKHLDDSRQAWLNPPDLVDRVPEVVPGYPDRLLPKDDAAAKVLKTRTLTNLYNERPTWLANAHRDLDAAVAAAYGWPEDISDDDALARLFELNQRRAVAPAPAAKSSRPKRSRHAEPASPLQPVAPPAIGPASGK